MGKRGGGKDHRKEMRYQSINHTSQPNSSRIQTNKTIKIVIGVEDILNLEHVTKHQTHIVFHGKGSQQRNQLIELLVGRIRIPRRNWNSIIHVEGEGIEGIIENDHLRLNKIIRIGK